MSEKKMEETKTMSEKKVQEAWYGEIQFSTRATR